MNENLGNSETNNCPEYAANVPVKLPGTIEKFVDELPIPPVLTPLSQGEDSAYYEIEMKCGSHKFHRDLNETIIYGFNGIYPGPTIETRRGETLHVKWINHLPLDHFLPVDPTLHDSMPLKPEVRTVVHLHGANVAPDSDGHPQAWFSRNYGYVGKKFSREVYLYPNDQQATTLWYHDHAIGVTRLNVYAGLAGFYLIHDSKEEKLDLPTGKYDIPLMIQDKTFREDGSLFYPPAPIVRAFIGNTMVVNGKVWPYLNVEPRKYRFRMLNTSNTNGFDFLLLDENMNQHPFWQIGTDGGLIERTQRIEKFPLDPAERLDVIIDFSKLAGRTITLRTEELNLQGEIEPFKRDVMQFRVGLECEGEDESEIPRKLSNLKQLNPRRGRLKTRRFVMTQDGNRLTINHLGFMDAATEKPEIDSVEIWELASPTFNPNSPLGIPPNITHPIHLHLVQFQILNRQDFDVNNFNEEEWINSGEGIILGEKHDPHPSENGWKDTVRVEPGKVTRIIVPFRNYTGEYVWHCHILEHEDNDMMRPLIITEKDCD
ncbi:multicopper oxidase domain-containing protein [Bacillus sp. ISL-55]|uniref:multicopper oxidase family protein n=1 Tax=Bacillus sp. ISL-55 TaxID=2819134 RepID=UPI001BE92AAF|nr:multicopper oxidase domain-containing protein [Bacillus sp. ISL-55]MBT2695750.1 multicopper oxidase domain-containing protein [Bacillus sp. ISL-55]